MLEKALSIGKGKTRDENGGKDFLNWIYSTYEFG